MSFIDRAVARATVLALALTACLVPAAGIAAELTLREALALTQERNPALAAFTHESEALRQSALARTFSPPLSLESDFENFAGSGNFSGTQSLEATVQLSKVVELGGKRQWRENLGAAELDRATARQQSTRADILALTAQRFLHVLSDQAQLEVTRRATGLAERARGVVQARIREGAISTVYLNRAEIELARARIAEEHAEHELAASRVALAILWADTTPGFERAGGDLFALPALEPLDQYLARLERNPELVAFATAERVLDARRRLAEAGRTPDLTLSAGVRHLQGFGENALVAGFSIPIGTRARALPEVRATTAEGAKLALDGATRRLELHSVLFGLYQEALHARTEANALHAEIRPQAQKMVETTSDGYAQGRYSLVELIDAQQALIEVERDSIRAALEFHNNLVEIERVTGVGLHTFGDR
jgi:outer membrane protein, heavy metal efflux system